MAKFRQALDLFNTRDLDFMIELGDFKDCQDNGDREGTLNFLKTIENEYRTFNGPRYHIAGNHDFDKISYSDYLVNTPNYGPANGKSYYSFTFGGVKYIVLDACFNNMKGEHYSEGNFKWTVNMIPDEELAWFKEELGKGSEPVIVMTHQNLNYWAQAPFRPLPQRLVRHTQRHQLCRSQGPRRTSPSHQRVRHRLHRQGEECVR